MKVAIKDLAPGMILGPHNSESIAYQMVVSNTPRNENSYTRQVIIYNSRLSGYYDRPGLKTYIWTATSTVDIYSWSCG